MNNCQRSDFELIEPIHKIFADLQAKYQELTDLHAKINNCYAKISQCDYEKYINLSKLDQYNNELDEVQETIQDLYRQQKSYTHPQDINDNGWQKLPKSPLPSQNFYDDVEDEEVVEDDNEEDEVVEDEIEEDEEDDDEDTDSEQDSSTKEFEKIFDNFSNTIESIQNQADNNDDEDDGFIIDSDDEKCEQFKSQENLNFDI